jgi:hypothetical protein
MGIFGPLSPILSLFLLERETSILEEDNPQNIKIGTLQWLFLLNI